MEQWYPCQWKPSGLRLFSPKKRLVRQLMLTSIILILGLSFLDIWALLLIVPLLLWWPIVQVAIVRYGQRYANNYFVRDWKGLTQNGEYLVARGHLFLRVPGLTESYVKPTGVRRTTDTIFNVRGSWLKRFRVEFNTKEEGDKFYGRINELI